MEERVSIFLKRNLNSTYLGCFVYKTKFTVLFPKYQENYIQESWSIIIRILSSYQLESKLDLKIGYMEVTNNLNTSDPFIIIKARDFLKLISRSVPIHQAAKIFDDNIFCDIIKISSMVYNKKVFLKRRRRLIGNKGTTIKAIEIITKSYILIQGNTVSCMGQHMALKNVRRIVEDCMKNIHPILHIKALIIKKELMSDVRFKSQSWDKFLPEIRAKKKKNIFKQLKENKLKNSFNYLKEHSLSIYENRSDKYENITSFPQAENEFLISYNVLS